MTAEERPMADLGLRREDKSEWERRVPLTPQHVEELVREQGRSILVQPSDVRVFADEEYLDAGAEVHEDLSGCQVILGVKEVPPELLLRRQAYLAFFHVIKGQPYNMPLLRRALDLRCTMMDYERILDRYGKRLIFFGRHAGYAGMIDALWALGRRMEHEGEETVFADVQPAHAYDDLSAALSFLEHTVDRRIRDRGIGRALHPLVFGFTGGGNVSQGAQEVLDRLPVVEIRPEELATLESDASLSRRAVYKVVFRREDRRDFDRYLPYLSVLVNGIYWQPGDPRLVTQEDIARLWADGEQPKLRLLADLSCDLEGSIEVNVEITDSGNPIYVYDAVSGEARYGVRGHGPVVLAVDNLPCELPRDASEQFGDLLFPFLSGLAAGNFDASFEHLALPAAILNAVVAHAGELTPAYGYLEEPLAEHAPRAEGSRSERSGGKA